MRYKIGAQIFFQTNSEGAKILFDYVAEYADFKGDENVYDLYTGLGSIALYIAHKVARVTGIEEIPEAIADANENCRFNGIENASFMPEMSKTYSMMTSLKSMEDRCRDHRSPRAGMSEKVIETLMKLEAPKIVYVSCNPETQARDVFMMSEKYQVVKMQPVDMFPHTNHIENVALLVLKS